MFYLALLLVWYFSKHFLQMNSSHFEQYEDVLFLDWVLSALCTYTHTAQHLQIRCLLNWKHFPFKLSAPDDGLFVLLEVWELQWSSKGCTSSRKRQSLTWLYSVLPKEQFFPPFESFSLHRISWYVLITSIHSIPDVIILTNHCRLGYFSMELNYFHTITINCRGDIDIPFILSMHC